MAIVWRGLGILVPILFVGAFFVLSRFYEDHTLGNVQLTGWSLVITAVATLLVALARAGGEADENVPKPKDDLFFVPLVLWPVILGALAAFCLTRSLPGKPPIAAAKVSDEQTRTSALVAEEGARATAPTREIAFHNDSDTEMAYLLADTNGVVSRKTIAPRKTSRLRVEAGSYFVATFDAQGKQVRFLPPDKEYASNKENYLLKEDSKGKFFQRIVRPSTPAGDDYDVAWFALSGANDFVVVDVSDLCRAEDKDSIIQQTEWQRQIKEILDGKDLMEPLSGLRATEDGELVVLAPATPLPSESKASRSVFALVPIPHGTPTTRRAIAEDLMHRLAL